jgi:hypothetical protein
MMLGLLIGALIGAFAAFARFATGAFIAAVRSPHRTTQMSA